MTSRNRRSAHGVTTPSDSALPCSSRARIASGSAVPEVGDHRARAIARVDDGDCELAVRRLGGDEEGVALGDAERRLDDRVGVAPELGRLENAIRVHAGESSG